MNRFFQLLCVAMFLCTAGSAQAQTAKPLFQVKGFRSASFGMTQPEVRAAIDRDFKPMADAVTVLENPIEKTSVIVVRLPKLEPGPTPATISYIIGATSRKLIHVNVAWTTTPAPGEAARDAIAVAGVQLANYFRSQAWRPNTTTSGITDERKGVVLFAGIDARDAAVEVRVSGVEATGTNQPAVDPASPAMLVVSYVASIGNPDVAVVKPGSF